jgi:hypothetical protein
MRSYFAARFPHLLMVAYAFGLQHCAEEPAFAKYYPPESREPPLALDVMAGRVSQGSLRTAAASGAQSSLVLRPSPDYSQ